MPKTVRIVLAVVLGFIVGSLVNMSLILVSGSVIPPRPVPTRRRWKA